MGSCRYGKAAAAAAGASALTEQCKNTCTFQGDLVHVWAVTMHLPAIISTENVGFYIQYTYKLLHVVPERFNIHEKVIHSIISHYIILMPYKNCS